VVFSLAGSIILPKYYALQSEKNPVYRGSMLVAVNNLTRGYFSQKPDTFFYNTNIIVDALIDAGMTEYKSGKEIISLTDSLGRQRALDIINRDFVLANNKRLEPDELERYTADNAVQVLVNDDDRQYLEDKGITLVENDFIETSHGYIRHDAKRIGEIIKIIMEE
jgi:hypothetical protein